MTQESPLRPEDMNPFRGATSEPPPDYQIEPFIEAIPDSDDRPQNEPVPVIIMDTVNPADFTDWAPEQFHLAGENPVRIAGARENRTRLLVTNIGPDPAYVIRSAVGGSFTGAPLPVNSAVELTTNRDVFATCRDTDTADVGVIQEFVIDDEK